MPGKKRKQSESANDSSSILNDGIDSVNKGDDSAVSKFKLFDVPTEACRMYTDDDIQALDALTQKGLTNSIDGLEGITDFMPLEVFRCVASHSYRSTKMDADEQKNFLKIWGDRTDALKSYHRYILRRTSPSITSW